MANTKGQVYGLTILSPIKSDTKEDPPHAIKLCRYLARLETGANSPLSKISQTHMARFAVIDDVYYQNHPSDEEHLRSQYLLFCSNFDRSLDDYLDQLADRIPNVVDEIWSHCIEYPGRDDRGAFRQYFKKCQVTTTHFFADYPDSTVEQALRSLDVQRRFVDFAFRAQDMDADQLKEQFYEWFAEMDAADTPEPGSI